MQPFRIFITLAVIAAMGRYIRVLSILLFIAAAGWIGILIHQARRTQDELAEELDWLVFSAKELRQAMAESAKRGV